MSQLHQKLTEAAEKNRELLAILRESDYATPALKQNTTYIADLKAQIASTDKTINSLHQATEKERKEHVKIRDSVMRRYASKIKGQKGQEKFSAKQDKEEREFLEAWQKERESQERRIVLGHALEQAEKEKKSLEADKTKHKEAQRELNLLYIGIFSGPTPEVPGEDDLEQALSRSCDWYDQCKELLARDKRAAEKLEQAKGRLKQALFDMKDSLQASNFDRFGGGALFDMMERDALSRAQTNLNWCNQIMAEASRAQPAIPPLREVAIDHGHVLGDILFDNIFSDFAQHERIKNSAIQMQQAAKHLESIIVEQKQRLLDSQRQETQAIQQLEEARAELQQIRTEAFERFAGQRGGEGGDPDLPAYSA